MIPRPDSPDWTLVPPEYTVRSRTAAVLSRFERSLWGIVVVSMLLDVVLTAYGLQFGLAEANPVANHLIQQVGFVPAFVLLKGLALAVALLGWVALPENTRVIVPVGLAAPWCFAVAVNLVAVAGVAA